MKYFSFERDNGITFHDTAAEAKVAAEAELEAYQDIAGGDYGWPEGVEDICWGEVSECVKETNREPAPENSDWTEIVAYELLPAEAKQ